LCLNVSSAKASRITSWSVRRWRTIASKSIWRGFWDIVVVNVDLNLFGMLHADGTRNVSTVMFVKDCICALRKDRICRNADLIKGLKLTTTFEVQLRIRSQSTSHAVIEVSARFGKRMSVIRENPQQINGIHTEAGEQGQGEPGG
jgi:hypothetical protein